MIYRHALRNALIPVITVIGMQLATIFGGSIIVESIYSIPGMGVLLLTAINSRDYTTIPGNGPSAVPSRVCDQPVGGHRVCDGGSAYQSAVCAGEKEKGEAAAGCCGRERR